MRDDTAIGNRAEAPLREVGPALQNDKKPQGRWLCPEAGVA